MHFLYEPVLYVCIVPLVFFLFSFKIDRTDIAHLFSPQALDKVRVGEQKYLQRISYRLLTLVSLFLLLALARPVIKEELMIKQANQTSLVVAIDVSKSMSQTDIYPSRLDAAKQKLDVLIAHSKAMNMGVILFTQDAYSVFPMSDDREVLASLIKRTDFHANLGLGSNIFAALQAGKGMLSRVKSKNILLLSDGGNSPDMREELQYLTEEKIRLYALDMSPKVHKGLKDLALHSGGLYQKYALGEKDIETLVKQIEISSEKEEGKKQHIEDYTELFIYPLALSVVMLFFIFSSQVRWQRPSKSMILMVLFLGLHFLTTPVQAGFFDFYYLNKAHKFYKDKNYHKAVELFKTINTSRAVSYNLANALYHSGQYDQATQEYKKLLQDKSPLDYKIYHNMANAYVQLDRLSLALKYYEKSLEANPKSLSQENLQALEKVLTRQQSLAQRQKMKPPSMCHKISVEHELEEVSSDARYEVKIDTLVSSEEDLWMRRLEKDQTVTFLQKIKTDKRSHNASLAW